MYDSPRVLTLCATLIASIGVGGCDVEAMDTDDRHAHGVGADDLASPQRADEPTGTWTVSVAIHGDDFTEYAIDGAFDPEVMGVLEDVQAADHEDPAAEHSLQVVMAYDDVEVAHLSFPAEPAGVNALTDVLDAVDGEASSPVAAHDDLTAAPRWSHAQDGDCDLCEEAGGVCCEERCEMSCPP